jgi:hypothetical protein
MLQPGPAMARNNARFTPKAREGTEIVGNLDAFLPSCLPAVVVNLTCIFERSGLG